MLEGLRQDHDVERVVGEREGRVEIGLADLDAMFAVSERQGLGVDVRAGDAVAVGEVSRQGTVPAPEVEDVLVPADPRAEEPCARLLEECLSEPLTTGLLASVVGRIHPL